MSFDRVPPRPALLLAACMLSFACGEPKTDPVEQAPPCGVEHPEGKCPEGETCHRGVCRSDSLFCSAARPNGLCATEGDVCLDGHCVAGDDVCGPDNPHGLCPAGQQCMGGACSTNAPCGPDEPHGYCDDGERCIGGTCVAEEDECSPESPDGVCPDGQLCEGGVCVPGEPEPCSPESPGGACPDGEICEGGECVPVPCSPSNPDGACPEGEMCEAGVCVPGEPESCSPSNPGGACPEGEMCEAGVCVPGEPEPCSPSNPGGACPEGEMCEAGVCVTLIVDLALTGLEVLVDEGETVLAADVENFGNAPAVGFHVELFVHADVAPGIGDGPGDARAWVPSLSAGESTTVEATIFDMSPGSYQAWAFADAEGLVGDADLTNNVFGPVDYIVEAYPEVLAHFDFEGPTKLPQAAATGVQVGAFDNRDTDAGFVAGNPGEAITDNGWREEDENYFQTQIVPGSGKVIVVTEVRFDERPSATGPTTFSVTTQRSAGGTAALIGDGATNPGSWSEHEVVHAGDGTEAYEEAFIVRIAATGASSGAGTWRLDNVSIIGLIQDTNGGGNGGGECQHTLCPNGCFDLQNDVDNCGSCGYACPTPTNPDMYTYCENGVCEVDCIDPNLTLCGSTCEDLNTGPEHCGRCGRHCNTSYHYVCESGECVCPPDRIECPIQYGHTTMYCFDPMTSTMHCGSCFNDCFYSGAGSSCIDGQCG